MKTELQLQSKTIALIKSDYNKINEKYEGLLQKKPNATDNMDLDKSKLGYTCKTDALTSENELLRNLSDKNKLLELLLEELLAMEKELHKGKQKT